MFFIYQVLTSVISHDQADQFMSHKRAQKTHAFPINFLQFSQEKPQMSISLTLYVIWRVVSTVDIYWNLSIRMMWITLVSLNNLQMVCCEYRIHFPATKILALNFLAILNSCNKSYPTSDFYCGFFVHKQIFAKPLVIRARSNNKYEQ